MQHKKLPWKSVGSLPDDQGELARINQDLNLAKRASYGEYYLDRVIKETSPMFILLSKIFGVLTLQSASLGSTKLTQCFGPL